MPAPELRQVQMGQLLSRRDFAKATVAWSAFAGSPLWFNSFAAEETKQLPAGEAIPRYRAVSWWLTWQDLAWPNTELMDQIRRRADQCAESAVNCCLIFGAHFRWDFMPLWGRLHDELRFIVEELHQRRILLFDHHSSVLTHRPRDREAAKRIWQSNRHHLPFYPSREAAAAWEFDGSRLNDWRMRDVETTEPIYLPSYEAEQFCMNNTAFRAAYGKYLKQLLADTGVDGLMSDDNIFYADWRACGCEHCRARFKREYGHELPPVSDAKFWGVLHNPAFKDWIEMRFQSAGDFLRVAQQALPADFPLMTCCASSDGSALPAYGMSYQDFIRHCNHVLLEMVGSTPSVAGTWDDRVPSQLLHLGIAREHRAPCFGLGYGFFPDTAFLIWAVNKFLGSDCWMSTLKGRLNASTGELAELADDPGLVGEGYRWERERPGLFSGETDTDIGVFFSRASRDFHGQVAADYASDYATSCLGLMRGGVTCDVVTGVPAFGRIRTIVLSSAICLGEKQREELNRFMQSGGLVIATGPTGNLNQRANSVAKPWLREFGISAELVEPARSGGFPPYENLKPPVQVAACRVAEGSKLQMENGWLRRTIGKGEFCWRPERISEKGMVEKVLSVLGARKPSGVQVTGCPAGWHWRQYRAGRRLLLHALPAKIEPHFHATLKNQVSGQRVIDTLKFAPLRKELTISFSHPCAGVALHSPDLKGSREGRRAPNGQWVIDAAGVLRYFVLEASVPGDRR